MNTDMKAFLKVTGTCARGYMGTGGPTTRLEERLEQVGAVNGIQCEVYATPTAIFVSAKKDKEVVTSLERTTENTMNFMDMLFYDSILDKLSSGAMSISSAETKLSQFRSRQYSFYVVSFSAFLIGFFASFPRYGSLIGAFVSGIISALIYLLQRPLGKKLKFSGVFNDFISCLVAFGLSVLSAYYFEQAVPVFVIGSLILIVPGLTLTSAISELAEHNFVSGTVKMMKSILILVAMGVAYLLIENTLVYLGYVPNMVQEASVKYRFVQEGWFQLLSHAIIIVAFCLFFHMPKKAFMGALISGLLSVLVLEEFENPQLFVLASYSASLTVGLLSLLLARFYSWPSQVFSTTGILSLVPGLLALSSFYNIGSSPSQGVIAYKVALTAGAITFGLFTARMPFRFYNTLHDLPVTK